MKRFVISYEDSNGQVFWVGGTPGSANQGIEAISLRAATEFFWRMWTVEEMPRWVTVEEV